MRGHLALYGLSYWYVIILADGVNHTRDLPDATRNGFLDQVSGIWDV